MNNLESNSSSVSKNHEIYLSLPQAKQNDIGQGLSSKVAPLAQKIFDKQKSDEIEVHQAPSEPKAISAKKLIVKPIKVKAKIEITPKETDTVSDQAPQGIRMVVAEIAKKNLEKTSHLKEEYNDLNDVINPGIWKNYQEASIQVPYEEYHQVVLQENAIELNKLASYSPEELEESRIDGSLAARIAKICDKINDQLRPKMKNKDNLPITDDIFEMLKENSREYIFLQLVILGLIIDPSAEKKIENQLLLSEISVAFQDKILRHRINPNENSPKELLINFIVGSFKTNSLSIELLNNLQKSSMEKHEEEKQQESDLKHHTIKQVEIQRALLREEIAKKDAGVIDINSRNLQEIVEMVDGTYQHNLIDQKLATAAGL